ncbi:hypothetical protein E2C01_094477 [Portunus trituberculatus]|uniref:Uncharacterized protein n=1 Tax=Portunus trituberculatus TaxID=210409 RepID=A0A5B7JSI8_PORTR|nr:hypothetical protein [Portunus trituberculatus]
MIATTRPPSPITHALCHTSEHGASIHRQHSQNSSEFEYPCHSVSRPPRPPAPPPQLLPLSPGPVSFATVLDTVRERVAPMTLMQEAGKVACSVPILVRTVKLKNSEQLYDFKSVWLDTHRILNNTSEYWGVSLFFLFFFFFFRFNPEIMLQRILPQ